MRAALWILALFGVAVAVALFAGNNHAVVTLFWPPHRVDISLNLVVLVLAGAFVLVHFALKALSALASLPVQARRWRAQQKERAMYAALMDALARPAKRTRHVRGPDGRAGAPAGWPFHPRRACG
jgi:HemY protein